MYRFLYRPKWLAFHVLAIAAVVVMINLGFWQLRRLDQRQTFNTQVTSHESLDVVPIEDVVGPDTNPDDVIWRNVTATGTYLPDEQVIIVNRAQENLAGVNVVTPLQLAGGTIVLVNRGFVASTDEVPAPPEGTVEVLGRIREGQERTLGQLSDPAEGELTEAQRIDIPRLAPQMPGPVEPVYLDLISSEPDQGPIPVPVPEPEVTEGPHLGYAVQWFIFSACVPIGWVLAVRKSAASRRAAALAGGADLIGDEAAVPGATPPSDDAAPMEPS